MPPKPRKRMSIHERIFKETPTDASKRTYGGYIRSTANGEPIAGESDESGPDEGLTGSQKTLLFFIIVAVIIAVLVMVFL